jgi:hypothetical protein
MIPTAKEIQKLAASIFVRFNFEGEFKVLLDENGDSFTDLVDAIDFIRNNKSFKSNQVELTSLDQALINNALWDNL